MPRASRIDIDSAADAAMAVFWSRGYAGASFEDLVAATGAARYGLYHHFGDKRGLFLAALGRYEQVVINRLFAGVEAPDAGLDQVRGYFEALIGLAASPQGRWGCLLVNAAIERAPEDDRVGAIVAAYRERLRAGFRHAGAPAPDLLVSLAFGLWVQARAGAEAASLAAAVDTALPALG